MKIIQVVQTPIEKINAQLQKEIDQLMLEYARVIAALIGTHTPTTELKRLRSRSKQIAKSIALRTEKQKCAHTEIKTSTYSFYTTVKCVSCKAWHRYR